MKKKYYILIGVLLLFVAYYFVDQQIFMKKRVLRHNLWEYDTGDRIRGDFLETKYVVFKKDTMIFDYSQRQKDTIINYNLIVKGKIEGYDLEGFTKDEPFEDENVSFTKDTIIREPVYLPNDTLILIRQYFSRIVIMDPKTKKVGKYTMKGASWFSYLFR